MKSSFCFWDEERSPEECYREVYLEHGQGHPVCESCRDCWPRDGGRRGRWEIKIKRDGFTCRHWWSGPAGAGDFCVRLKVRLIHPNYPRESPDPRPCLLYERRQKDGEGRL